MIREIKIYKAENVHEMRNSGCAAIRNYYDKSFNSDHPDNWRDKSNYLAYEIIDDSNDVIDYGEDFDDCEVDLGEWGTHGRNLYDAHVRYELPDLSDDEIDFIDESHEKGSGTYYFEPGLEND